jgi:hypothetical protein
MWLEYKYHFSSADLTGLMTIEPIFVFNNWTYRTQPTDLKYCLHISLHFLNHLVYNRRILTERISIRWEWYIWNYNLSWTGCLFQVFSTSHICFYFWLGKSIPIKCLIFNVLRGYNEMQNLIAQYFYYCSSFLVKTTIKGQTVS